MKFHQVFLGAGLALAFSPLLAQSGSDSKSSASPSIWSKAGSQVQEAAGAVGSATSETATQGWEATSEVGVVAGKESAELTAKYNGGMAIYQIGEKGLLFDANISGSKYWIDKDLTQ